MPAGDSEEDDAEVGGDHAELSSDEEQLERLLESAAALTGAKSKKAGKGQGEPDGIMYEDFFGPRRGEHLLSSCLLRHPVCKPESAEDLIPAHSSIMQTNWVVAPLAYLDGEMADTIFQFSAGAYMFHRSTVSPFCITERMHQLPMLNGCSTSSCPSG